MAIWAFWIGLIVISFGVLEAYAVAKGKPTLSRSVWAVSKAWPPFPLVFGLVFGFVSAHFWWGGALICYQSP